MTALGISLLLHCCFLTLLPEVRYRFQYMSILQKRHTPLPARIFSFRIPPPTKIPYPTLTLSPIPCNVPRILHLIYNVIVGSPVSEWTSEGSNFKPVDVLANSTPLWYGWGVYWYPPKVFLREKTF